VLNPDSRRLIQSYDSGSAKSGLQQTDIHFIAPDVCLIIENTSGILFLRSLSRLVPR